MPVDYIAPTDEELQSLTDDEILGPREGATVDDLAGRYAIELEIPEAELEALGISPGDEEIMDLFDLEDHCYVDLKHRRMVHGLHCRCIKPSEVAGDNAHEA